jgi:hypothetical protein
MLARDILLLKIISLATVEQFSTIFSLSYVNNLCSDLLIFSSVPLITNLLSHSNYSSSLLSARLKAFKMSLDQVETVTKLLRASRTCNELVLKDCFKEILENGITSKELNSTDKSGRVSESDTFLSLLIKSMNVPRIRRSIYIIIKRP